MKFAETHRNWGGIFRYLLVGGASFVVVSMIASLPLFFPTFPAPLATALGVLIGGVVNFAGHRYFTFGKNRPLLASLWRYCILITFNSALAAGIVAVLTTTFSSPLIMANCTSLLVITATTYVLLKRFVI